MKTAKIKTINDIFKYVNKTNVEGFLEDFSTWVTMAVLMKNESSLEMNTNCFEWNDDGNYGEISSVRISSKGKKPRTINTSEIFDNEVNGSDYENVRKGFDPNLKNTDDK